MRPLQLGAVLVLLAGCSEEEGPRGVGTLVYSQRDTRDIRILDLATGSDQLIDDGEFGSLSIAPDAQHVAYLGGDKVVKVADRAGAIAPIDPASNCNGGTASWVTNNAIVYCIDTPQQRGSMLLPSLGTSAPRFFETPPVISADGTQAAFVDAQGNVVLENADGSSPRVLIPSADPTALFSYRYATMFTPDQQHLIVEDAKDFPTTARIVPLDGGAILDVPDASFGGNSFTAIVSSGSVFSPDGSEVVMQSSAGLVAVSLATGAKRTLAELPPRVSNGGAVFLDDGRVAWLAVEDTSVGDLGDFNLSVHVSGPDANHDVTIIEPRDEWWSSIAISPTGLVAVPSDELLVSADGTVLARNDTSSESALHEYMVGISADGSGVVTASPTGELRFVGRDGGVRHLADAAGTPYSTANELWGPFAAFTPTVP